MSMFVPRARLGSVMLAVWAAGLLAVLQASLLVGSRYYRLARELRPDHMLDSLLRPGGGWGLLLALFGTSLMLVMHLYTLRKWMISVRWLGPIDQWLRFHILCGIFGPAFILLHAGLQLPEGMIAVGLWCMVLVAASGVFGRYVFGFLPRMTNGRAMAWDEALARLQTLRAELVGATAESSSHAIGAAVQQAEELDVHANTLLDLVRLQQEVLCRRVQIRRLLAEAELEPEVEAHALTVLTEQLKLKRGLESSRVALRLLRYWHLFHRPLAKAMYVLVAVHVVVALLFGDALTRMSEVLELLDWSVS